MSAFMCNKKHFQYLANAMYTFNVSDTSRYETQDYEYIKELVNSWIDLNIRALAERYEDSETMHGKPEEYYIKSLELADTKLIQLIKALHCLRYQCSEGNAINDKAFETLERTLNNAEQKYITDTEDYNNAEWEVL